MGYQDLLELTICPTLQNRCPGPAQAVGPVGPWPYHFLAPNILHEATHACVHL